MAQVKTIRSLSRGLEVLERLDEGSGATLHDLHKMTSLPKATLLRVLKTLEEQGWVHCSLGRGIYNVGASLRAIGSKVKPETEVAELATPILERLCHKVMWPSDVALFNGHTMEIMETSRKETPFVVNREVIRIRPHMLWSALGRAYLAFCPDDEREEILATLRGSRHTEDKASQKQQWVDRLLKQTRKQGFGIREPGYWIKPKTTGGDLGAIAVPVMVGEKVVACINLLWIAGTISTEEAAMGYIKPLKEAAAELAILIDKKGLTDNPMTWIK